jgi:hypothetical protein
MAVEQFLLLSDKELSKKIRALALPELREETLFKKEFILLFFCTVSKRTGMFALVWSKHARNCENISNVPRNIAPFPMK